jgi:hypothetical protein
VQRASSEAAEEAAPVADEQFGGLHRGEVAAAVELRPVDDVVVAFSEPADGDVVRSEDRDASRRGATFLGRSCCS